MGSNNNLLITYFDFYVKREAKLALIDEVATAIQEKNWYLENNKEGFAASLSEKSQQVLTAMKKRGFNTTDVIVHAADMARLQLKKERVLLPA
jgi:hypothetical protein